MPGDHTRFEKLFGWAALNELLNSDATRFPRLQLARAQAPVDPAEYTTSRTATGEGIVDPVKMISLCQAGATIVLAGVHRDWLPLRQLADEGQAELGEYTQVNAYCSWPGVQGFDMHFDTHEALILQIEGRKLWRVFEPTDQFPSVFRRSDPPPTAEPYVETVLSPGELIYIPRGHWHYAAAQDEPSVHLTVGVACRTGVAFLKWLEGELLKTDSWRANLPLCAGTRAGSPQPELPAQRHFETLVTVLRALVSDPQLVARYISDSVRHEQPRRPYCLPYQVPNQPFGLDTVFSRPASQHVVTTPLTSGAGIQVDVWGRRLSFKGALSGLVPEVFSRERFAGSDLLDACSSLTWAEVRPLLEALVRSGVLFVDGEQKDRGDCRDVTPADALIDMAPASPPGMRGVPASPPARNPSMT